MTARESNERCMIYRKAARVVATACLGCGLSQIACESRGEFESQRCCQSCNH